MSSEGARHSEGARTSEGAPGHGGQLTDNKSNEQSHQQSNQRIDHNANQCADSRYNLQTHQCINHISQTRPPSKTTHSMTTQQCQHHRQQPTNQNTSATSNGGSKSGTTCHEHTSTRMVQYSIIYMVTRHNPRICCGGYEAETPSARNDAPHTQNHTIRE
jgi:hypothetical protein